MELVFLGTGPVRGVKGQGKSTRFESSALIKTATHNILIDVTSHFLKQAKLIKSLDTILITHAHQDAIGGIGQLISWMKRENRGRIHLFSHLGTIKRIAKQFPKTDPLILAAIKNGQPLKIGQMVVTPFLVRHSIQPGFPTLGFHFSLDGKRLVYVSDVASWNKKIARLMKDSDILVIDGAMWGKRMIAHLNIKEILPKICPWPVKKIIFTQIGRSVPKHEILEQEIKKICPKALPAYDGMVLKA